MAGGFYLWLVPLIQIGEIKDKLIEFKLLRVVRIVLFKDRLDLRPIRHIRVPQIKRIFYLRGIHAVLLVMARSLQQQRYLLLCRGHGICRPMSCITIDFYALCKLFSIQAPRLVVIVFLYQCPQFLKMGLLCLTRL